MGLNQINLTDYDMVVAVTQNALNETLATYLNNLNKNVALYYNVDENGNFIPATDPATAYYTFTGTLDYTTDDKKKPVDIIQLYTDKGNQTVLYNITFSQAHFFSTIPPFFNVSQPEGTPWIIQFSVSLATAGVNPSEAPANVQSAVSGLPADTFSIQQLYIDLNTANYDTYIGISGLKPYTESILSGIMQAYLASLKQSNGIIFGYAVQHTASGASPTFMPTALQFCITPYTDSKGNHSVPGLDTLNYLVMINNNPLPPYPPSSFGFNFVDDNTEQGAMAIRYDHYVSFLVNELNAILQGLSPVAYVHLSCDNNIDDQTMQLNTGSPGSFTINKKPVNGVVAQYNYSSPNANATKSCFGGDLAATLTYSANCSLSLNNNTATLSGSIVISADSQQTDNFGNLLDHSMPATTYSWSIDIVLQVDLTVNGQLDLVLKNGNFTSAPTVQPQNQSAWDKFWESVGGVFQEFVNNLGDLRTTTESTIVDNIQPNLSATIKSANQFIFPGGITFVFANPQFSATDDLAANITYLNP